MSGGSYDYLYMKVDEMAGSLHCGDSALRRAFAAHLRKVAKAMHDIEWVDSCDYGPGDEMHAIRDCLGLGVDYERRLANVDAALACLNDAIEEAFGPKKEPPRAEGGNR